MGVGEFGLLGHDWEAGCSALSWDSGDGCRLWGRNYDFDRLAQGSMVTFLPREQTYRTVVSPGREGEDRSARYACLGTGLLLSPTPVLYEGVNEKGLMGGQLYYRTFACYREEATPGTVPLQPPFLVYHLLAQCATVEEAVACLEEKISLVDVPFLGTVPPLHWAFRDAGGETVVVEPDRDGLHIYRRTLGVMTNSPSYPWHRLNLLNYAGIQAEDRESPAFGDQGPADCFSGSGAQGLPGDWSSPSRFVRLTFLKKYALPGRDEAEGVARMFRLLQSAAFPLGMVRVHHQSQATELDQQVIPFDYTVYTSIACAQSLRFYWTTYGNQRVRFAELGGLLERRAPLQFSLDDRPDFLPAIPTP